MISYKNIKEAVLGTVLVASFVLAFSLVYWEKTSAYFAVIDLSQVPNYNTNVNTSVDSSADVSVPGIDAGADANADAGVNGNAGEDQDDSTTQNNTNANATNNTGVDLTANAISGSSVLNMSRAEIGSDANVNSQTQSSAETNGSIENAADVETVADLKAYASSTIRSDEMVDSLNFTSNAVEMKYKQEGKFLALIPITFNVTAKAKANGEVELSYPWYAFLTIDNGDEMETELKVAVDNALRARTVGSVQAEGEVENPTFTASEQAEIMAQMQAVLSSAFESENSGQVGG